MYSGKNLQKYLLSSYATSLVKTCKGKDNTDRNHLCPKNPAAATANKCTREQENQIQLQFDSGSLQYAEVNSVL